MSYTWGETSPKEGQTSYFSYGADGLRRTSQVGSGPETQYVLDGQTVVRERCENSNIATCFTSARGIEYRRDDTADDPGNPSRHVVRWYLYDGLGSVIAEVGEEVFTETDGTPCVPVLGVNRLDVYGNDLGGSSGTSSHKFVGKLGHTTDSNTGLVYMQARYYDPALGRFISEDSARDGVNWFVYCRNNPVNLVDPDGKAAIDNILGLSFICGFIIGYFVTLGRSIAGGESFDATAWKCIASGLGSALIQYGIERFLPQYGAGQFFKKIFLKLGTVKGITSIAATSFILGYGVLGGMALGMHAGEIEFETERALYDF